VYYLINYFKIYYPFLISLCKFSSWLQQNYLQSILCCLASLTVSIIQNHPYDSFKQLRKKEVENNNGQPKVTFNVGKVVS